MIKGVSFVITSKESRVRQAKPSECLVSCGVHAGDNDFLARLNDQTKPVEEAGTLRLPMLTEQIRRFSEGVRRYEHPVKRVEQIDQNAVVFDCVCSQPPMLCD